MNEIEATAEYYRNKEKLYHAIELLKVIRKTVTIEGVRPSYIRKSIKEKIDKSELIKEKLTMNTQGIIEDSLEEFLDILKAKLGQENQEPDYVLIRELKDYFKEK